MLKAVSADDVQDIHDRILETEPGIPGTHIDRLEGVIGRVEFQIHYGEIDDPITLAAAYAVAISRGHPFVDGNKRTAFTVCVTVLQLNNLPVPEHLSDHETWADVVVAVAEGSMDRSQLARFIADAYARGATGVSIFKLIEWLSQSYKI